MPEATEVTELKVAGFRIAGQAEVNEGSINLRLAGDEKPRQVPVVILTIEADGEDHVFIFDSKDAAILGTDLVAISYNVPAIQLNNTPSEEDN